MAEFKVPKVGVYGPNMRKLQRSLALEHVSLTWKPCFVYKYLGSRANLSPAQSDIQDYILLENRDRAYAATPIKINVWYDPLPEQAMDFARLGIINPMGNEEHFKFHIDSFQADGLGRYLLEGDILEIPFLVQDGFPTRYEITDVDRKLEFENFYVYVTAIVMEDKQETAEIQNKRTQDTVLGNISTPREAAGAAAVPVAGVTGTQTSLTEIILTAQGTGYLAAPTISFTGGGPGVTVPATATAYISSGQVTHIVLTNSGQGYTLVPTVVITGANTTPATATAVISGAASVTDSSTTAYRPQTSDTQQDSFLDDPTSINF